MKNICLMLAALCLLGCKSTFEIDLLSNNHPLVDGEPTPNHTQTVYPVVFVHGLYGFDDIFGMPYWYQIPDIVRAGGAEVFVARVSGTNSPEVRGEQLITQLEDYAAISGKPKFNLIGHSLGGPTIRYVAGVRPDLVASLTTVSGVNYGSPAADAEFVDMPLVSTIINIMGNVLGHVIDMVDQDTYEQSIRASLDAMKAEGITAFNASYPDGLPAIYCNGAEASGGFSHGINAVYDENNPSTTAYVTSADFSSYYVNDGVGSVAGPYNIDGNDIYMYSFSGNAAATNSADPLDGMHKAVSKLIDGDDDDGFVNRCSTHLGYVVKDNFVMNHLDVMNWFVGLRDARAPFAPAIYRAHVNHLKTKGL